MGLRADAARGTAGTSLDCDDVVSDAGATARVDSDTTLGDECSVCDSDKEDEES